MATEDDEDLARTKQILDALEKRMWPTLAAMAHSPDEDQLPTRFTGEWLIVKSPGAEYPRHYGKWLVERAGQAADDLWGLVYGAVMIGRLYVAKASGFKRASFYGGRHLIAVYTIDASDLEDARKARAVLRELGVVEAIPYLASWDGYRELLRE